MINPGFAYAFGQALGRWLATTGSVPEGTIYIGRDPRPSGADLARAVEAGLQESGPGFWIERIGIVPTPVLAWTVKAREAKLGVMITASHNPVTDNGFKLFNERGEKLEPAEEVVIEGLLGNLDSNFDAEASSDSDADEAIVEGYIAGLLKQFSELDLSGMKLVVDTANGATRLVTPEVLRRLGADVVQLGDDPDGSQINVNCGSEHPRLLGEWVRAEAALLGLAHDGDGDRVIFVDHTGKVIDGDQLLGLHGLASMTAGWNTSGKLVATVQSNGGLDQAIRDHGGEVYRSDIGDRNVAQRMKAEGCRFGGENSGHLIFGQYAMTGDGLVAGLMTLQVVRETGKTLRELADAIPLFPQKTGSLRVEEKAPLTACLALAAAVRELETQWGSKGRVLVRYSGTEPKLRLLTEHALEDEAQRGLRALVTAASKDLSVVG